MKKGKSVVANVLVILMSILWLFPVYIVFVNSFKNRAELYENMLAWPKSFSFEYYEKAMKKMKFFHAFGNSLFVTIISILIIVVLASMTAWMLVRANNLLSKIIFSTFVATMLIPFQTLMMPLMQEMGWIRDNLHIQMLDNKLGLVYMYIGFGASMAVFLYHGFVKSIPVSLEEAATIDGCTKFGVFWKIVFPMLKPTTMTVIILDVIWIWNDYLLPYLLIGTKYRTIPVAIQYLKSGYGSIDYGHLMAAIVVALIPIVVFYFACQKYIIEGIVDGAVKG